MKNIPTIHELRSKGYKVRVTHVRKFHRFDPQSGKKRSFWAPFLSRKGSPLATPEDLKNVDEFFISIHGGETIVEIADPSGKEIGRGVAKCSEQDPYVKKIGIKKATALAFADAEKQNKIALAIAIADAKKQKDPYFNIRQLFYKKK